MDYTEETRENSVDNADTNEPIGIISETLYLQDEKEQDKICIDDSSSVKTHKAILSVAHILQQKYIYISGNTDKSNHPLLLCAYNRTMGMLTDEEFSNTVDYLKDISRILWEDGRFLVIIDRQYGKWNNVRTLLQLLQIFSEEEIHEVLILKPQGFLQKHFGNNDPKQIQELSKHKIVFLENNSDLEEYVDLACLPDEYGGFDNFNVNEWVEYTTAVERFEQTCNKIQVRLKEFRKLFTKRVPLSSSSEIEYQRTHQQKMVDDILDDIKCAVEIAETLKPLIDKPLSHSRRPPSALERFNSAHLEACTQNLSSFGNEVNELWTEQIKFHKQSTELCNFEESFGQVSINLIQITSILSTRTIIGDSLQSAKELVMELDDFDEKRKEPYDKMMNLKEKGVQMIAFFGVFAKESVKIRCDEIKGLLSDFDTKFEARKELLKVSMDIFTCLDQLDSWCKAGIELLASHPVEAFNAVEGAKKCLAEIDGFMKNKSGISMKKVHQLHVLSKKLDNPTIDEKVAAGLARIEEVKTMLQKRETSLKKVAHKQERPVQRVKAIVIKNDNDTQKISKDKTPPRTPRTPNTPTVTTPMGVTKESIEIVVTDDIEKYKRNKTFRKSLRLSFKRPLSSPELLQLAEFEEDPEHRKKIRHVITELIDTELVYVNDLKHVIEGYFHPFDDPAFDIPDELRSQKNTIFGNIYDIYKFHNEQFLESLQGCKEQPYFAGHIFLEKKEQFQLYATYCKNKPNSEILRKELHKTNFSQACQIKLGHSLNLNSYLLKPVQRITKYRLLLTEMLKYVGKKNPAHGDILEALVCMKRVLRHVNDVMHSSGLSGFPRNLDEQGKLLLQDSFTVWEGKKNGLKLTKLGAKTRQVFFFEKCLIFSKKEMENSRAVGSYQYKRHIWTVDIGVTETVKGDENKFQVWVQRTNETYTLQGANTDVKHNWVTEIRKMLMLQFEGVKETINRKQSSTEDRVSEKALSKEDIRNKLKFLDPSLRSSTPTLSHPDRTTEISNNNSLTPDRPISAALRLSTSESNLLTDHSSDSAWSDSEFDDDVEENTGTEVGITENTMSHELQVTVPGVSTISIEPTKATSKNEAQVIKFTAVADYDAVEETELSFSMGDLVSLIKEGDDGWWYCKHLSTHFEGWAPSGYLELYAVDVTLCANENYARVEPVKPSGPSPRQRLETTV